MRTPSPAAMPRFDARTASPLPHLSREPFEVMIIGSTRYKLSSTVHRRSHRRSPM